MTRAFRADASRLLAHFRVQPAAVLCNYPNGRLARASGLLTHRQRPQTAKGTMFVMLEDDTGTVNAIVWPSVVESERKPLLGAKLLTLFGRWQRPEGESGEGGAAAMHLVVMKAIDHSHLLQSLVTRSRDFRQGDCRSVLTGAREGVWTTRTMSPP